jgi:lysophospholipase
MVLAFTEKNPIPPATRSGSVYTPDSVRIRYALWKTNRVPVRGSILILHGRTEYVEKYFETAADLVATGYDVCTFDWRGQGGSSRMLKDPRRGYVDSFDQYLLDLDAVLAEVVLPDCRPPHCILGHSTGGLVALLAAPRLGNRVQRMVLSAPLLRFAAPFPSQNFIKFISGALAMLGLGEVYLHGGPKTGLDQRFTNNPLTGDIRRFERNAAFAATYPQFTIDGPTASWVFAACQAMDRAADPDFIGEVHLPILLVAAGNDNVVSNPAIEELGFALRSGRAITIDGARHELLQERDVCRAQFLAALTAFIPGEKPDRV